jgi:cytochrome c5
MVHPVAPCYGTVRTETTVKIIGFRKLRMICKAGAAIYTMETWKSVYVSTCQSCHACQTLSCTD